MTNTQTHFSRITNHHEFSHRPLNNGAKDLVPTVQKIIECITERIDVSRIYQMGYRSCAVQQEGICGESLQINEHFDLLVITDGVCMQRAFDLQGTLNKNIDIPASASIWVHRGADVEESLTDMENGYFFHQVLRDGQLLYQKPGDPEFENVLEEEPSNEWVNSYTWANRHNRAKALMNAAVNITEDDTEVVELWLLHQAMEQVCLAFIFVMIGYKPNQHSLSHLFSICRCISSSIHEVFPIEHKPDRELFKVLINSGRKLRYHSCGIYSPADTGMLYRRCRAWMEKAEELVSKSVGTHPQNLNIV